MGRTSRASLAECAALDGGRMERGIKVPGSSEGMTWHATWPGVQNVNMSSFLCSYWSLSYSPSSPASSFPSSRLRSALQQNNTTPKPAAATTSPPCPPNTRWGGRHQRRKSTPVNLLRRRRREFWVTLGSRGQWQQKESESVEGLGLCKSLWRRAGPW